MYSSSDFVNDIAEALCRKCPHLTDECDDLEQMAICTIGAIGQPGSNSDRRILQIEER
jgi:hypothetical protein